MLGLRPPLRTVSLLSHFCRPHYFPAISFLHFLKPRPPSVLPCPGPMSARPSAFDALMSSARAAAAKTKKPSPASAAMQSPNKKRKSPEPEQNPSKPPESADSNPTPASEAKKPRPVEDRVVALKSKVSLLRRKPAEFDAEAQACWGPGERVPFLFVCSAFELIAGESGRIVITDIVCNMLRTVLVTTPEDLLPVVYLLANKVAPAHEGVELGIGEASIIKALSEACGRTEKQVKSQYKEMGDLGLVAKASRGSQSMMRKPDPLTVAKVFQTFQNIAKESGKDSQERKKNHIKALLVAATDCEPLYLIRLLQAKLRIGLAEQTLLSALAQAAVYSGTQSKPPPHIKSPLEEATKILKQVYSVVPVYDRVIPALVSDGIWNLSKTCNFAPGVPVGPMLAKATKGVAEIVNKFQDMEFTCEYKYDGERAQIHFLENGSVEIYSRNAERNTGKFPDVVVAISRLKKPSITSFILDCELVAYDREKKRILPFQSCIKEPCVGEYFGEYFTLEVASGIGWFVSVDDLPTRLRGCCGEYPTSEVASWMDWSASVDDSPAHYLKILSTRARKNVVMSEIKVEVCIFAFDLLYFNGQPLIQEQLEVRKERLHSAFDEEPGFFQFATALTSNDLEEIQKFLDAAVEASSEGLIIKTLNKEATYEPSKRSNNWLKLKKDYMESIGDSLDLVPIAAIHGRGKRTGVYGAFYLACYDSNNDEYQSICKIGTGFSEAMLEERSASLRSKVIPSAKSYYRVGDGLKPDVWFEPCEVWEVKAADLTISPIYQAAVGEVDPNKGISLRFPRLLRVREDKSPEQASSSEQVAEMYNAQQHNQHNNNNLDDEDD